MNEPITGYLVVFEKAEDGSYSVYVPDLPGCVSSGDTLEEAHQMIREAIGLYIEDMTEQGLSVPPPAAQAGVVQAA